MSPHANRREIGSLPAARTRRAWGSLVITAGLLGYGLGLAIIVAPVGLGASWVMRGPAILIGGAVVGASYEAVRLGRRMRVKVGIWETIGRDPRPSIVYLRPFEADGVEYVTLARSRVRARPARRMFETTYEQRLARALADVAPLIAIANPSEALPEPGAVRLPAEDWEWQDRVAELTSQAGSIILHSGVSDGLAWEIGHIVDLGRPERVIIALPSEAPRWQPPRVQRYAAFVARFGDVFPRGLPEHVGDSQFLFFDLDWSPHRFGHRDSGAVPSRPGAAAGAHTRAPAFRVQGVAVPVWLRATAGMSVLMFATLAVGTAIYAGLQ